MLTTRRRLASVSFFLAIFPTLTSSGVAPSALPASILLANIISSSADSRGTRPISFKYMRTGSSILTPSGTVKFTFTVSFSDSSTASSFKLSFSLSCSDSPSTSTPLSVKCSYILSISSAVISQSPMVFIISE